MSTPRTALAALAIALAASSLPALAMTGSAPSFAPVSLPSALPRSLSTPELLPLPHASSPSTLRNAVTPAAKSPVVRIGTSTVLIVRGPANGLSALQRAEVIQSRVDAVLLNHPYLTFKDVRLLEAGGRPVIYIGQFPIATVDEESARANRFSSAEVLAHAWATNLRRALRGYFSDKRLPERALYHTPKGSDFTYRRTPNTLKNPALLRNLRYVFSPDDFEYGAGVKAAGQAGFVIFARKDAGDPPASVFLGNPEGGFTEYELVKPEDQP